MRTVWLQGYVLGASQRREVIELVDDDDVEASRGVVVTECTKVTCPSVLLGEFIETWAFLICRPQVTSTSPSSKVNICRCLEKSKALMYLVE